MLNNFILLHCKDSIDFKKLIPSDDIDTWHIIEKNSNAYTLSSLDEHDLSLQNIIIGCESKNSISSLDNKDLKTIITGDPYKLYPDTENSLLDIILLDNDDTHQVHHNIGGAFTWIEIFTQEGKIKINTDMFGQLPLFYYHDENMFAIATSIDLLLQSLPSLPRNVNLEQILEFIVTGSVADEYISFFKYIHRLKGNQTITYDSIQNTIAIDPYISLENFRNTSFPFSPQNLRKDIEMALNAATHNKKVAYGLSGGIDSTLLCAVGADQSLENISCYTAATGFGQDLTFSRIAASYMKAQLLEVPMDYDAQKLDYIEKTARIYGQPVHIWGNTIGNAILTQTAKEHDNDIFVNGSSEHAITGGVFTNTLTMWIHQSIKKREWKILFDALSFNHQHKVLSSKNVLKEILNTLFENQSTYKSKLQGKDFQNFFIPKIQSVRDNLQTNNARITDIFHYYHKYLTGGRLQQYTSQSYQSGNISNINVRLPFLDSRLIKYIDHSTPILLKNKYNKQLAREAMAGIMDNQVIYREDNEGLRWKSTKLVKDNKDKIIEEIRSSSFFNTILSEKTLHALDKATFRKSLLLSLYSVALFDKVFHIEV